MGEGGGRGWGVFCIFEQFTVRNIIPEGAAVFKNYFLEFKHIVSKYYLESMVIK
jgi:hypothetical protein